MQWISVFLLFSIFSCQLLSRELKEFEISQRVGSIIDLNERNYFKMFNNIENFRQGVFYLDLSGNISCKVDYDSLGMAMSRSYQLSSKEAETMKWIIEEYEGLFENGILNFKIHIQYKDLRRDIIVPGYRYEKEKSSRYKFTNQNNLEVTGKFMYADSNVIIICPENYNYDWRTFRANYSVYHYSDIKEFKGNKYIYNYNLQNLRDITPFNYKSGDKIVSPPPEIAIVLDSAAKNMKTDNSIDMIHIINSEKRNLHIGFNIVPGLFYQIDNTIIATEFLNYYDFEIKNWVQKKSTFASIDVKTQKDWIPEVSIEYTISEKLRIGLLFNYSEKSDIKKNANGFETGGLSTIAYLDYIPSLFNPYSLSMIDRFQIEYSIGILFSSMNYQMQLIVNPRNSSLNRNINDSFSIFGCLLSVKFNYYLVDFLSINLDLFSRILTSGTLKHFEIIKGKSSTSVDKISVSNNDINYSGVGLKLGIHFHLL